MVSPLMANPQLGIGCYCNNTRRAHSWVVTILCTMFVLAAPAFSAPQRVVSMMLVTRIVLAPVTQRVHTLPVFRLMIGGTVGAQFGASAGKYLRGDQRRARLALLVLGGAIRFGLGLVLAPSDPFSMAVLTAAGAQ